MRGFLLLIFLFCQLLSGEEELKEFAEKEIPLEAPEADKNFSLVDLSASPIPRVFGSVNVISGNWVEQETHDEVTGPDPYVVAHSHVSGSVEKGSLADGWDFFHASTLEYFESIEAGPDLGKSWIHYREPGGSVVVFKRSSRKSHFHPVVENSGYTFFSSISKPDRRDLNRIQVEKEKHTCTITLGDGTRRIYKKNNDKYLPYGHENFHIEEEYLPSGNIRQFEYDRHYHLTSITTLSSDKKHTIHVITFTNHNNKIAVTTSDGLTTTFHLKEHKKKDLVEQVNRPGRSDVNFEYDDGRIQTRILGSGRKEHASLYHRGKNHVHGEKIEVTHKEKFLEHRVKTLHTKALPGDKTESFFSFAYKQWNKAILTKVYEPNGAIRSYWADNQQRPTWVSIYDSPRHCIRLERFGWTKHGELTQRVIYGEGKQPLLSRQWIRDDNRNVVKEIYRGIFTGKECEPLVADAKKRREPSGGEEFAIEATYDKKGQKTGECDALGNWTYYEYDPDRYLMTARFTCDQKTIIKREFFSYDSSSLCIEEVVDDGSRRDKDSWKDVTRKLIHRTTPRYEMPHFGSPDEESWYVATKSGEHLLRKERYKRDKHGLTIKKTLLDTKGKACKTWRFEYDSVQRLVKSKDPTGRVETFSYDSHGRTESKTSPEGTCYYTYDLFDRVIEEKTVFPDGSTASLCRSYDLLGKEVKEVDFRGRSTTLFYDSLHRCVKKVDPQFEENTPSTTISYNLFTEKTRLPSGATLIKKISSFGKPLEIENAFGAKTTMTYDLKGRLVEKRDATGLQTLCEYDALDRQVHIYQRGDGQRMDVKKTYRGSDLIEEEDDTKVISYTYDSRGRKISEEILDLISNQSSTTRIEYDTLNRPCKIIRDDVTEETSYDLADRVIEKKVVGSDGTVISRITKKYDLAGRVIEEGISRCKKMAITKYTYGAYGLLSSITLPDGTESKFLFTPITKNSCSQRITVDPQGVTTEELVDVNDQPIFVKIKDPFGTVLSERSATISIHKKPSEIREKIFCQGKEKETITTSLSYDKAGQLTQSILAHGTKEEVVWKYQYDTYGRKVAEIKPSNVRVESTYDERNRLIQLKSSDGSIFWKYFYNKMSLPEKICDEVNKTTTLRSYDGLGHIIKETLGNGAALDYTVDAKGLLSKITYPDGTTSLYSYKNQLLQCVERKGLTYTILKRDASGVVTKAILPGACGEITSSIDIMGRRKEIQHKCFSEKRTSFNEVGLCTERVINNTKERFSYDFLHQLTSDNGKKSLFDSGYRRLESDGKKATHNALHQMVSQGAEKYTFDNDGRRTSDSSFKYTYDACDRLLSVEDATHREEFTYDPFHRRLTTKKLEKQGKSWSEVFFERYLWSGETELGSMDRSGKITTLRIFGEGLGGEIGAAVLFEVNDQPYVPLHDLSGHLRATLNTKGKEVETFSYTAFTLVSRSGAISPWSFASKRQDDLTGLFYFGRRFYDQETAGWLTQDPIGVSGGNLYAYVGNNPLMMIDVFGLSEEDVGARNFFDRSFREAGPHGPSHCIDFCVVRADAPFLESTTTSQYDFVEEAREKEASGYHYRSGLALLMRNGEKIEQVSRNEFFKRFKGKDLQERVANFTNGMNTKMSEALEYGARILEVAGDRLEALVVLHNSTHGFWHDLYESSIVTARVSEQNVGRVLHSSLCGFLKGCKDHNIRFVMTMFAHSEGAAITRNILLHGEFDFKGINQKYIASVVTFGGAVTISGGTNYVADGDIVPRAWPGNWPKLLFSEAPEVIRVPRVPGTTTSAHAFMGDQYQWALQNYFASEGEWE